MGDMKGADALLDEEGEEDVHVSDSESDRVSLASDLDEEDLQEIEENEKRMGRKLPKKKCVTHSDSTLLLTQRSSHLCVLGPSLVKLWGCTALHRPIPPPPPPPKPQHNNSDVCSIHFNLLSYLCSVHFLLEQCFSPSVRAIDLTSVFQNAEQWGRADLIWLSSVTGRSRSTAHSLKRQDLTILSFFFPS